MKTEAPTGTVAPGYEVLADVLSAAFDQAAYGKGKDRHADNLPFDRQPMQTIAALVGDGFLLGQAIKKAQESRRLPYGPARAELLGAINYLAGAVVFLDRQHAPANDPAQGASPGEMSCRRICYRKSCADAGRCQGEGQARG